MLDQFLATVYRHETEKTASSTLEAKLRTMPTELVEKIAFGNAPKCIGDGEVKCWLDNFKGTPLFEKAVELERAEIQLEQADIEQRMNMQSQDSWTKRDALRLQKKMLELDLAMAGAGGDVGTTEIEAVSEEPAAEELEQIPEEAVVAEEGPPAPPAPPAKPPAEAAPPGPPAEEGPPAPPKPEGAEAGGQPPFPPKAPPKPPAKKEPPKEGAPEEDEKQASLKVAAAAAAGRLLAKTAGFMDNPLIVGGLAGSAAGRYKAHKAGGMQSAGSALGMLGGAAGAMAGSDLGYAAGAATGNRRIAAASALAGALLGGVVGFKTLTQGYDQDIEHNKKKQEAKKEKQTKEAAAAPEGHFLRRALLGNPNSAALEAAPGSRLDAYGEANGHVQAEGLKGVLKGGLGGAALGALAGGFAGARSAPPGSMLRNGVGTALAGGLAAGALGAGFGGGVGSVKGHFDEEASRIHGARSKHKPEVAKTAGISVGGLVGAAKAAVPQVAGVAQAGKSLVGTAMKAGGLPQVAKSVGNVATGFAKANPLAAAGAAGAAGLAAGRLSKGNSQPRV